MALETRLYPPLKLFLEARGFAVKGEVGGCDIVAVRAGEPDLLVIVEQKLGFSLELVLQGVDRLGVADEVWLAVLASRRGRDRDRRVRLLCKFLGVGLLAVTLSTGRIDILCEPAPYRPRVNARKRGRLLVEHGRRLGDPTPGGSVRAPIMTAYRQRALALALALRDGPQRPRDLRALAEDAGAILLRNVYGWFARERPGVYRLNAEGEAALARFGDGSGGV